MKKIALLVVAAVTLFASGAMAQGVGIGVGPGGVGVRVDDGYRGGYRERPRHRDERRHLRRGRGETVIIQRQRPRYDRPRKEYYVR